jgi:hypothetical protein
MPTGNSLYQRRPVALCHCVRVNEGCFLHNRPIDCISRFEHRARSRKTAELSAEQKQQSEEQQKDERGKWIERLTQIRFHTVMPPMAITNPESGRCSMQDLARSREADFYHHFCKPVEMAVLEAILREAAEVPQWSKRRLAPLFRDRNRVLMVERMIFSIRARNLLRIGSCEFLRYSAGRAKHDD